MIASEIGCHRLWEVDVFGGVVVCAAFGLAADLAESFMPQ
jgi:hypothetical protein